MLCQSHPPWLDRSNYTWRKVQVMKLLIIYCSFLKPHVTLSLFGPNILLSTLFSNTLKTRIAGPTNNGAAHKATSSIRNPPSVELFISVGCEILPAVVLENSVPWDMTLCSQLKADRNSGWTPHLYLILICLLPSSCWFLAWSILKTWRRRRLISPERQFTVNGLDRTLYSSRYLFSAFGNI
jgi:hypothetical protein